MIPSQRFELRLHGLAATARLTKWKVKSQKLFRRIVIIAITVAGITFSPNGFGQTVSYTVSEIQGGGVPNGLNNLGDVAGRAYDRATGEARATKWNHGRGHLKKLLGKLSGG